MERDSLKGLSNGMDSKRCMIFTKPLLLLKKLMMITEIRLKSGKNDMAKKCEGGKKAYTDGYRIFRERMRFDNQDKSLKEKTGEKDNYTHYI